MAEFLVQVVGIPLVGLVVAVVCEMYIRGFIRSREAGKWTETGVRIRTWEHGQDAETVR